MIDLGLKASYVAGLLTAFTPCVYPLIPITIGIMGARGEKSLWHKILLSGLFVAGLSLVYASFGFVAAASGKILGSAAQNVWVSGTLALLFLAMGLSLLGLFNFSLPSKFNQKISKMGGKGPLGAFILGGVSGLLAAPCAGPVVVAILGLVAQKSNPVRGFGLLLSFAVGLGTPFFVLGVLSQQIEKLPKSGIWLVWVKHLCGFALIAAAIIYAAPYLPESVVVVLISSVFALSAFFAPQIFPLTSTRASLLYTIERGVLAALSVAVLGFGLFGNHKSMEPKIPWVMTEAEGLHRSAQTNKPIMIDVFADWCVACKELDLYTYADSRVEKILRKEFIPVKIDATDGSPEIERIVEKYKVLGLPTVLFLDPKGKVCSNLTLTGFADAEEFLTLLNKARTC